jgi:hypothetical protein
MEVGETEDASIVDTPQVLSEGLLDTFFGLRAQSLITR